MVFHILTNTFYYIKHVKAQYGFLYIFPVSINKTKLDEFVFCIYFAVVIFIPVNKIYKKIKNKKKKSNLFSLSEKHFSCVLYYLTLNFYYISNTYISRSILIWKRKKKQAEFSWDIEERGHLNRLGHAKNISKLGIYINFCFLFVTMIYMKMLFL